MTPDDHASLEADLPPGAQALLDAVIAISTDLDMHNVLRRIVQSACTLTNAQYGALGVVGGDGDLSDFITHGVDDDTHAQIGDLPHGRGILGLLIHHPVPIRLQTLQKHPDSFGFPANHPPMESFLGVPVRIRGVVFGNLYLTEKADGAEFTDVDEQLIQVLASAAGFVIENARAYAMSELQRTWLEAAARLDEALQPPIDLDSAMQQIAVQTRSVARARAVGIVRRNDALDWQIVAADGRNIDRLPEIVASLTERLRGVEKRSGPEEVALDGGDRALVVPLHGHLAGDAVLVAVLPGPIDDLAPKQTDLLGTFAAHAALALDRIQAMAQREELAIVSDRDRIARDLHDLVIQRLFATGLQLQGVIAKASVPQVRDRLERAVADLDATIRDIRTTIFELQHGNRQTLRSEVLALLEEYEPVLRFRPAMRTAGPVDSAVPEQVGDHLLAVLREAVSNIARHSGATTATIELNATPSEVVLIVCDDGVGVPVERAESGLRNARNRAQALGGSLELGNHSPHGTVLTWRVPLHAY
ncbi:GAF domain-containing sensor histidine kinase [Nocardioides pacificus]